jgi:hypothetical protein
MLSLPNRVSIEAALRLPLDPYLHTLLVDTWRRAEAPDLLNLTHILVIQSGDGEASIEEAIGFSPLVNPIDGARFGTAPFQPYWSWHQDLDGWYEMIVAVGDSGFAFIVLIAKAKGVWPELLQLCEQYSGAKTVRCA